MRILHCLSQIPGKTGSGVYLQAIVREAIHSGFEQAVVCGLPKTMPLNATDLAIESEKIFATRFDSSKLPFPVAGMSDVMPYPSTRFSSFDEHQLKLYKKAFSKTLTAAVEKFSPDLIHSHHLWLLTALCKELFPEIPLVTSVHGTELRQLQLANHLADKIIKNGGVISFPTRHLYGLGADALNEKAVSRIYKIKNRPLNKPISVIINRREDMKTLVQNIPVAALKIMDDFWPGEITIIFQAANMLPEILTAGTGKIGIRLPRHPVCR